jgi:hypothetical protein
MLLELEAVVKYIYIYIYIFKYPLKDKWGE